MVPGEIKIKIEGAEKAKCILRLPCSLSYLSPGYPSLHRPV